MQGSAKARKTFYLLIITVLSMAALTAASFAWMSISSTPTVTDLALTVISDNALELSADMDGAPAGEWSTLMDMGQTVGQTHIRPVTYLASEDAFFLPTYGLDGRASLARGTRLTDENGALYPEFEEGENRGGYLYVSDFWIRTNASDCVVAFTAPMEREDGVLGGGTYLVGEPVWDPDSVSHVDGGNGAQYAIRIALRIDPTDDQGVEEEPILIFYEPNADGGTGMTETMSADGTGLLQGEHLLLQQSVSAWEETTPVLRDELLYHPGSFLSEDLSLFSLRAGHARHVTLYLWLEGQDADCVNSISAGRLLVNLQFTAITENGNSQLRPD